MNDAGTAEARRKRLEARGKPIPDHLWPPEIIAGAEAWFEAFWELSTDRRVSEYGTGPIPASSIRSHTEGWPEEDRDAFRVCIRAMDAAFLKSQSNEPDIPESDNPARDMFRARMGGKKA